MMHQQQSHQQQLQHQQQHQQHPPPASTPMSVTTSLPYATLMTNATTIQHHQQQPQQIQQHHQQQHHHHHQQQQHQQAAAAAAVAAANQLPAASFNGQQIHIYVRTECHKISYGILTNLKEMSFRACPRDSFIRRRRLESYPRTIPPMRYPLQPLLSPLAPPPRQLQHSRITRRPLRRSLAPQPLLCNSLSSIWEVPVGRPAEAESGAVQWDAEDTSRLDGEEAVAWETARLILGKCLCIFRIFSFL